ncbi:hypothetical protein [Metabacillus schmidteae]|uniref:hypothetical protein n=1 Tax=Metabacillus schmidteae TaxID=2730405 RepID=UPI00158DB338|nr:hypothetical protein [Metabacillus schmidteae]
MIEWRKKHTVFIVFTVVITGLLVYFSYLLLLQPKSQEIKSLQGQIDTENTLIQTLQASSGENSEGTLLSAVELQKILPVSPFEEQFLLDLEKAETISSSLITTLSFQDGEAVTEEEQDDELVEAYDEKLDPDSETAESEDSTETATSDTMPKGIEKLTVELSVTSPSYYEVEEFLRQLENTKRITQIESVSVEGKQELIQIDDTSEESEFTYQVVVSTFYLPNLEELKDQLPPFHTPAPSDKENPFTNVVDEDDE